MFILKKKKIGIIAVVVLILVAYSAFSAFSWSDIKNQETWLKSQNSTISKIFDSEVSLSKIQELLKPQKKTCQASPLASWQGEVISPLKNSVEICNVELSKFEKYQSSLKSISEYLEDDQKIAQEIDNFADKIEKVDSKNFEKMLEVWREFGENVANLKGPLAEKLKSVIAKVEKSLQDVVSADKVKDFERYSQSAKKFDEAVQEFLSLKNEENIREKIATGFLEVQ